MLFIIGKMTRGTYRCPLFFVSIPCMTAYSVAMTIERVKRILFNSEFGNARVCTILRCELLWQKAEQIEELLFLYDFDAERAQIWPRV